MKFAIKALTASVILACAGSAMAQKGETVKVAWIDPLGPDGSAGIQSAQKPAVRAEEINKSSASG
jgi:branched-chain amino acid transport system substrate-binding protein